MSRDLTALKRDELLRLHRIEHDLPDEAPPTHLEGPEGGYTARLARELRAEHDTGSAIDPAWLRAHTSNHRQE
jgi:hypothetical protein